MGKKKVNRYTEEFRRQAMALAAQQGKTAKQVADELGIHVGQIYNWKTQFNELSKKQFVINEGVNYNNDDLNEIKRLKHEIAKLKKENAFLKKAAAYFANTNE